MMQQKTGLGILEKKMKNKIFNISKLSKIIKKKKQSGSKIVLCHGVFDLVHYGHIAHFKNPKKKSKNPHFFRFSGRFWNSLLEPFLRKINSQELSLISLILKSADRDNFDAVVHSAKEN